MTTVPNIAALGVITAGLLAPAKGFPAVTFQTSVPNSASVPPTVEPAQEGLSGARP